jgi:16S rRNA U516 pseudouridylate synthase RsuA-like enzyme
VSVNGRVIQSPDHWVDLERDKIALDGKPIQESEKVYLLLYKPKGYLTTYKDPEGRPTVCISRGDYCSYLHSRSRLYDLP